MGEVLVFLIHLFVRLTVLRVNSSELIVLISEIEISIKVEAASGLRVIGGLLVFPETPVQVPGARLWWGL